MKKQPGKYNRDKGDFDLRPISENEKFHFSCYPGISCFNNCCHDIDVVLTPFDVLRLKKRLNIRSDEFLVKYTHFQTYKDTQIPLLKLRVSDQSSKKCVFLNDNGCSVYESRPVVCRNYPTGIATQDPNDGQSACPYFIIEEDMCKGHFESKKWTISEWKASQNATELDLLNKPWLEIVSRLKSLRLKDDKDQKMNIFIMVSFDQDTFKKFVFESGFISRFDISQQQVDLIKQDDDELLKFGFRWLEFVLFGEGTLRPIKK